MLTYTYKDVGVKLLVTPYINSESGLVRLDIEQNVDKVSAGGDKPTTLTRHTKTSVQLVDGSTMVISGMVQDDRDKGQTGIPGLANLPVLGWLFKRESTSGTKSTLMVFISAKIIRTLESADALTGAKMEELERARETAKDYFKKEFEWKWSDDEDTPEEAEGMGEAPDPMELGVGAEGAYQPEGRFWKRPGGSSPPNRKAYRQCPPMINLRELPEPVVQAYLSFPQRNEFLPVRFDGGKLTVWVLNPRALPLADYLAWMLGTALATESPFEKDFYLHMEQALSLWEEEHERQGGG